MKENYSSQKEIFQRSYATGTDSWSDHRYTKEILDFVRLLPHKATVLDLGSGRGHWAFAMADLGMKVIGLDYVEELADRNNGEVKNQGYAGHVAFMSGDLFDIPLQEETIDVVTDFGTLQHIDTEDWQDYQIEVSRVLKSGGFLLLVQLSRQTEQFFDFHPNTSTTGNFNLHGLRYHFFDRKEIEDVFKPGYEIIRSEVHTFPEMHNHRYIFTLLKKK